MKRVLITLFVLSLLLKIEWLGINGAGALTVAQLLLTGWLDDRSWKREANNFPYNVTRDENGVIVWTAKPSTSKTTDSRSAGN